MRNRRLTTVECALNIRGNHGLPINSKTLRNRLRELVIRARRPYVGPHLTPARRQRRMAWVVAHAPRPFPLRQWRQVFFTNESRFSLYRSEGRQRVYRHNGEGFADACVVERDRFGGGSVMVWGGISHGLKPQLVVNDGNLTAARYRDEILRPHVIPFLQQHNLTLQQDNARPHVARICQVFLANNNWFNHSTGRHIAPICPRMSIYGTSWTDRFNSTSHPCYSNPVDQSPKRKLEEHPHKTD